MFSQHNEQQIITEYFTNWQTGVFLDIGAFHPETFSNTRQLYLDGWKGTLVEPSPSCLKNLRDAYERDPAIQILPFAIAEHSAVMTLHDSGGDAISSLVVEHAQAWERQHGCKFTPVEVQALSVADMLKKLKYRHYHFISIDCEGMDLHIFQNLNFTELETRMVCVEWNGNHAGEFDSHARMHGMSMIYKNAENRIYAV